MTEYTYDLALSYAGEDAELVEMVYKLLRENGVRVFFAPAAQAHLVGRDLDRSLYTLYGKEARYVAAFISKHYIKKPIPMHEAQAAMIRNKEDDFCLLPIYIDGTILPGLNPKIAYFSANNAIEIVNLLMKKIEQEKRIPDDHGDKGKADPKHSATSMQVNVKEHVGDSYYTTGDIVINNNKG